MCLGNDKCRDWIKNMDCYVIVFICRCIMWGLVLLSILCGVVVNKNLFF